MRREWGLEALIESWTLCEADQELIVAKHGATRLGFCLLLKYFEIEGRFPRRAGDIPPVAVEFVATQLRLDPRELVGYDWAGRSIKDHRRQIRAALGFREATATTVARLSPETTVALEALIAEDRPDDTDDAERGGGFFTELKADPRQLGLETLLAEIRKLDRVRAVRLPADLFTDTAGKRLARAGAPDQRPRPKAGGTPAAH